MYCTLVSKSFTVDSHWFNISNTILLSVLYSIWQYQFLIQNFTLCPVEHVVAPPPPPNSVYLLIFYFCCVHYIGMWECGGGGDRQAPHPLHGTVHIYFSGTVHKLSTGNDILQNLNFPSKLFLTTSQSVLNSLSIGILFPCLRVYIQYLVQ